MKQLFRKFIKSWYFEVSLVLIAVLGIIYILNIGAVHSWAKQTIHTLSGGYSQLLNEFQNMLHSENSLKIIGGIIALFFSTVLLVWRMVWRLQGSKKYTSTTCPRCEEPLVRVKSHGWQKKLRPILPLRRLYCRNCGWKGTRIKGSDYTPLNMQPGKSTRIQVDKIS
ncbi:hypothetical protein EP331_02255 [bacterium]|nr:MAG: hypothetical protein EP331_02255 [bacterium]